MLNAKIINRQSDVTVSLSKVRVNRFLAALAFMCVIVTGSAQSRSGDCGENANWKLESHTLTISGNGAVDDYGNPNSIYESYPGWYDFRDEIHHVIVGNGITNVGNYAFYTYPSLESVSLPDGLTRIGSYSFANCKNLSEINFPNTLENIGDPLLNYSNHGYSFENCIKLKKVILPESLKMISGGSFNRTGIETVEWNAVDCAADCFDPVSRYEGVFTGSPIVSVTFGSKVNSIPAMAFYNITGLWKVNTSGSIKFVGRDAFSGTEWLHQHDYGKIVYIDKVAYHYSTFPQSLPEPFGIEIKEGTTCVTDYLFSEETGLRKVTIPNSVKYIGGKAFSGCSGLTTVVWNPTSIDKEAPNNRKGFDPAWSAYDGASLFPETLQNIQFGNAVESLPDKFLYRCKNLSDIQLPASLKHIGEEVFQYCDGISSLVLPDNVETLGRLAISYCANLEEVTVGEGLKDCYFDYLMTSCPKLKTLVWNAVRTNSGSIWAAPIESLTFGDKVEYVPGSFCHHSTSIKNLRFGNSITEIGESAFEEWNCTPHIALPRSLKIIGERAFYHSSLDHIIVPPDVTQINAWALGSRSMEYAVLTPLSVPDCDSPFMDHNDEFKIYVSDLVSYRAKLNANLPRGKIEPMAIADRETFVAGTTVELPKFTCNIPGYTMTLVDMPEIDLTPGEHAMQVAATFTGAETFTADFVYQYTVTPGAGVEDIMEESSEIADVYSISGVLVKKGVDSESIGKLPAGLYLIKTANGVYKKLVK